MGYHPHAPHHVQSTMGMSNGLDPKFPPVAEDYHHYNSHYSMTASTGHMIPSNSTVASGIASHPHAPHSAEMVSDYMTAAAHHHPASTHNHHSHLSHSHHHTNSALSSHHQPPSYPNYGSTTPTHHHHGHHQNLGYYGHHAAAAAASAVAHHATDYISASAPIHTDLNTAANGYTVAITSPNGGLIDSNPLTTNGYYSNYYGTNGSVGSTHSQGHSPHSSHLMDMPLQCSSTEPPANTALGLQELGIFLF